MQKVKVGVWSGRLIRLVAALIGALAGAALGADGEPGFGDSALTAIVGVVLALAVLELALRLPSPFQRL
ncbi:hypothetical protein LLH00_03115 [bacterium]|nr:hypothetical protein [bacterium]